MNAPKQYWLIVPSLAFSALAVAVTCAAVVLSGEAAAFIYVAGNAVRQLILG